MHHFTRLYTVSKFKVGDLVIIKKHEETRDLEGDIYRIKEFKSGFDDIIVLEPAVIIKSYCILRECFVTNSYLCKLTPLRAALYGLDLEKFKKNTETSK